MCSAWARAVSSAQTSSVSAALSTARISAIAVIERFATHGPARPWPLGPFGGAVRVGGDDRPAQGALGLRQRLLRRAREHGGLHGRGHPVVEVLDGLGDGAACSPEISPRRSAVQGVGEAPGQRGGALHLCRRRYRARGAARPRPRDGHRPRSTRRPRSRPPRRPARPAAGHPPTPRPAAQAPIRSTRVSPSSSSRVRLGQRPRMRPRPAPRPTPHPPATDPTPPPAPTCNPAPPTTTRHPHRRWRRPRTDRAAAARRAARSHTRAPRCPTRSSCRSR